jgi:hypothetical protein
MNWTFFFRDILQPFLFFGLFLMTFITMLISIRNEKRAIEKHERDIIQSAKLIKRNYELLREAAKGHKHLQNVLETEEKIAPKYEKMQTGTPEKLPIHG